MEENLYPSPQKKLTLEQKAELKKLCEQKIQEYIASRGLKIWDYSLLDDTLTDDKINFRLLRESNSVAALKSTVQ